MRYPIFLIATLLFIFFFAGCDKSRFQKTYGPDIYSYPDSAMMSVFNYKPGTYWIYRDSLTGRQDSFYVTGNYSHDQSAVAQDSLGVYHGFSLITNYVSVTEVCADTPTLTDSVNWSWKLYINTCTLSCNKDYSYDYLSFSYPPDKNITSYPVLGNTYNHVTKLAGTASVEPRYFFIADTPGIIKMSFDQPITGTHRVWELVRSHIVR